jgi:hemolysin activation/secretion protein
MKQPAGFLPKPCHPVKGVRHLLRQPALLALLACALPVLAQQAAPQPAAAAIPQATGSTTRFPIRGFEVSGDVPLTPAQINAVLDSFVGEGSLITLQQATGELENALKLAGYELHRVSLPPQDLGGVVKLEIVRFSLGKITVEGNERFSEANVRASLPELKEGQAPNFRTLAVQTAIANENPAKQVQVSLKESDEADKIDVRLVLKESDPLSFSLSLSNTGSDSTGNNRLSVVAAHANVAGLDHQASLAYTTSPERIKEVTQLGLNYRIPLYRLGGVLGLSYTQSDVVGSFGAFTSTGAGSTFGINYSHYLHPEGGRRSYVTVGLDQKNFNVSQINGVATPGQLDRVSRPLTLGYTARIEADKAAWGYNVELGLNLPGGAGTDLAAYQSEDPRVSTVNWKLLRAGANYSGALASGWSWSARAQAQYSADVLISGEQFGIGGATSVRGTGERPLAADSGVFSTVELSTPELLPGLRALGFVDGGWLRNNKGGVNPNKPDSDQLASAGLGLRYASGRYAFSTDWARVVTGSVLPFVSGSGIPQAGDQKIHINLSARF